MQNFRNLKVWERAHQLTLKIYSASRGFPREELYGLVSQMRRSAASVGMNIAEGCCRKGDLEMARFVQIALGSASELEYQILLANDLHYLQSADFQTLNVLVIEVKRMLASLLRTLKLTAHS
jgi:four helix bundle protein